MQVSIFLMVAVESVLSERRIEGHAFQLQTRLEDDDAQNAAGRPTNRVSAVGVHRADGSIAEDVTLNWIVGSVAGLGIARPTPIELNTVVKNEVESLIHGLDSSMPLADVKAAIDAYEKEHGLASDAGVPTFPVGFDGHPMSVEEVMMGGHLSPVLVDITGQAVDDEVIFPAQYGSPDARTDGWYWSATVDTHKVGVHRCDLHIDVFRPTFEDSRIVWVPETYVLDMELVVSQITQVNGFTGAGIGYLPLVQPVSEEAAHV